MRFREQAARRASLLRLWHNSQIRLRRLPASGIFLLRLIVRNRRQDNYVVSLPPVHGCGYFVFSRKLHGVNYAKNFVEVAASAHGVADLQLDLFVWTNHKNGAHRGIIGGSSSF